MPDIQLPPWMHTDPLAGVPLFLSGFGSGAQAGASRRQGEQQAYEAELQQQASQERNELMREARAIQAQEFAESLKLRQETAKRAAAESAIQIEGQQGFERRTKELVASGIPMDQAFRQALPEFAPKLFAGREQGLADVMKALAPAKPATPGGLEKDYNFMTGTLGLSQDQAGEMAKAKFLGPSMRLRTPEGLEIDYGSGQKTKSDVPTAVETAAMKNRAAYGSIMPTVSRLESALTGPGGWQATGVAGNVNDLLGTWIAQVAPNMANVQALDTRTKMKLLVLQMKRTIDTDGHISETDKADVKDALPSDEFKESIPDAINRIKNARQLLIDKERSWSKTAGLLPAPWAMSPGEIISNYVDGYRAMTKDKLNPDSAEFRKKYFSREATIDALRTFYPQSLADLFKTAQPQPVSPPAPAGPGGAMPGPLTP